MQSTIECFDSPLYISRQTVVVVDTSTSAAVVVAAKSVIVNIQLGVMADGSNYTLHYYFLPSPAAQAAARWPSLVNQ